MSVSTTNGTKTISGTKESPSALLSRLERLAQEEEATRRKLNELRIERREAEQATLPLFADGVRFRYLRNETYRQELVTLTRNEFGRIDVAVQPIQHACQIEWPPAPVPATVPTGADPCQCSHHEDEREAMESLARAASPADDHTPLTRRLIAPHQAVRHNGDGTAGYGVDDLAAHAAAFPGLAPREG